MFNPNNKEAKDNNDEDDDRKPAVKRESNEEKSVSKTLNMILQKTNKEGKEMEEDEISPEMTTDIDNYENDENSSLTKVMWTTMM